MHGQQDNNEYYGLIVGHLKVVHGGGMAAPFSRKPNWIRRPGPTCSINDTL